MFNLNPLSIVSMAVNPAAILQVATGMLGPFGGIAGQMLSGLFSGANPSAAMQAMQTIQMYRPDLAGQLMTAAQQPVPFSVAILNPSALTSPLSALSQQPQQLNQIIQSLGQIIQQLQAGSNQSAAGGGSAAPSSSTGSPSTGSAGGDYSNIDNMMAQAESLANSDKMSDQIKAQKMMQIAQRMFDTISKLIEARGKMSEKAINAAVNR